MRVSHKETKGNLKMENGGLSSKYARNTLAKRPFVKHSLLLIVLFTFVSYGWQQE